MSFEPNEVEFLRRLVADMPAAKPTSVKVAAYFEAEHGIGVTIGRGIEYRARDFEKAAALLKNEGLDRKSTRLNSSHIQKSRMPSSA